MGRDIDQAGACLCLFHDRMVWILTWTFVENREASREVKIPRLRGDISFSVAVVGDTGGRSCR